tara:strand:+ start:2982 stop:3206 length:225 start_codon:yes stop_codon:yes gene_type:complete
MNIEAQLQKPMDASELAQELHDYCEKNKHQSRIDTIVGIAKKLIHWETKIRLDQVNEDEKAMKEIIRETKVIKN